MWTPDWYFEMTDYREEKITRQCCCLQDVEVIQRTRWPWRWQRPVRLSRRIRISLISDSTCVVASIQVSGRMLEQTRYKMFEKGFDADRL